MSSSVGDTEAKRKAYHLARHVQEHGELNGVKPEECGPFKGEAETLITAFRQHDADRARKVLDERRVDERL
jgi:hypothetical protein